MDMINSSKINQTLTFLLQISEYQYATKRVLPLLAPVRMSTTAAMHLVCPTTLCTLLPVSMCPTALWPIKVIN